MKKRAKNIRFSYVYFMQQEVTLAVKIGYTERPQDRLRELNKGSPYAMRLLCTMPGTRAIERRLHAKFRKHRLQGEWYAYCAEIEQEIKRIETGRPRGVVEKKGRWYYRPTGQGERADRAAKGLPETIPLGKANTAEARLRWAELRHGYEARLKWAEQHRAPQPTGGSGIEEHQTARLESIQLQNQTVTSDVYNAEL